MDCYENYKDIILPLYITYYKQYVSQKIVGLRAGIVEKKGVFYSKSFPFNKFKSPLETLEAAKNFLLTDSEFLRLKKLRDDRGRKPNELSFEESIEFYCKKFNISSFPAIVGKNKFIGIDHVDGRFVLIKECTICKKHNNVVVHQVNTKSLNGLCKECMIQTDYLTNTYKYLQKYYLNDEKTRVTFGGRMSKHILYFNKNISKKQYPDNFEEVVKIYEEYFLYIIDDFIIKNDLNFKRNLDEKTFIKFRAKYSKPPLIIKPPKFRVNLKELHKYKLRIHSHIFTAKIQGFGTNKKDESKMVLLNEVEYVGIDNFRDHMWTQFTKELDLPIGTTIKFKGEIYDYEREYLGTREVDKNGQAIKIIDLLEVDKSTRERVKLYK